MNAQATQQSSPIYTTSAIWHEVPDAKAYQVLQLSEFLNTKIDLKSFGDGLARIWFVAIIMQPEDKIHSNKIVFHRKTNVLEVYWRMDYARVMAATIPEFKAYLAAFFVEVIKDALEKKKVKGFDVDGFIVSIGKVLKEWIHLV